MPKSERPFKEDYPDWLKEIVEEVPSIVPFKDPSGQWRDMCTKNPLYPSMDTSPLPPWVRELKKMADRGELPPSRRRDTSNSGPRKGPDKNPPKK